MNKPGDKERPFFNSKNGIPGEKFKAFERTHAFYFEEALKRLAAGSRLIEAQSPNRGSRLMSGLIIIVFLGRTRDGKFRNGKYRLLFGVEDTVHPTIERRLITYSFHCFPRFWSFCSLFYVRCVFYTR